MKDYRQFIEDNLIDSDLSYRGGTIKVDASELFPYVEDAVVGAYQNYLGGGMLGAVVGASMFEPTKLKAKDKAKFEAILEACKQYLWEQTNHDDEWEETTYFESQNRPISAY